MKYEIMFIIKPNLEENKVKEVAKSFEKELAYEVKGFKTGYYFLINVTTEDVNAINEFDRLALISEDVIRHLIVKED